MDIVSVIIGILLGVVICVALPILPREMNEMIQRIREQNKQNAKQ